MDIDKLFAEESREQAIKHILRIESYINLTLYT